MQDILKEISILSIKLNGTEFEESQIKLKWLGNHPASNHEILEAENRLGITLPADYKEFLHICNGFHTCNSVTPTFNSVDNIEYLKIVDPELIKIFNETGNIEVTPLMERSIIIAGIQEEQMFLLAPPCDLSIDWLYWRFAYWNPVEEYFNDLRHYFESTLNFLNKLDITAQNKA